MTSAAEEREERADGHEKELPNQEAATARSWAALVEAVKTPLGFFTLIVVALQAIMCVSLRNLIPPDSTWLIGGTLLLLIGLVGTVSVLAVWRPEALGLRMPGSRGLAASPAPAECIRELTKPLIVCASTSEFEERSRRFEKDAKLVKSLSRTRHEVHRRMTEQTLRNLFLSKGEIAILHLCASLDEENRIVRLDESGSMEASALIALLTQAKTSLLILATCNSVEFAAKISHKCNVIASTSPIADDRFIAWLEGFYALLSQGHSVCYACNMARDAANVPIVLPMRQDFKIA